MSEMTIERITALFAALFLAYLAERVGESIGGTRAEQRALAAWRASASNVVLPAVAFGAPAKVHVYRRNVYRDATPGIERAIMLAAELSSRFQLDAVSVQFPEGISVLRRPVHISGWTNGGLTLQGSSQAGAEPSTITGATGFIYGER